MLGSQKQETETATAQGNAGFLTQNALIWAVGDGGFRPEAPLLLGNAWESFGQKKDPSQDMRMTGFIVIWV